MAALRRCICHLITTNPTRLLAVSSSRLQRIGDRKRFFRTNFPIYDYNRLSISESCSKQLEKILEKDEFLRILIEGGGCSGFSYKFEIDQQLEDDDRVFGEGNARVVVDEESLKLLDGSTIDYEIELIKSGFIVRKNPNADKGCSCGSSFSIKI